MATTVASFSAIDDTAIDAESPIVESMMKQMRDNSYWIDAGTRQTTETDTSKALKPDGSGGVEWGVAGSPGTKGAGTIGTSSGTATVIAIQNSSALLLQIGSNTIAVVSTSDDNIAWLAATTNLTGSFVDLGGTLFARKNGTDYEFYFGAGQSYTYVWL